jgi:hypothetical protein
VDLILPDNTMMPNIDSGPYYGRKLLVQGPSLSAVSSLPGIPSAFMLHQNYPNPFNPSTTIKFEVSRASHILLRVYDVRGREVKTLADRRFEPGLYQADWDGKDNRSSSVGSGAYFVRINAGGLEDTKRMVLVK